MLDIYTVSFFGHRRIYDILNLECFIEKYYDEIMIFEESQSAYPKAAFQIRNQIMIDRSDLIFFYVEHAYGGAYKSMKYAEKQGKRTINLYDKLKYL